MEYTMTRKEAKTFLADQANRYWTGEISWSDYKAIEIKYTPLDLTAYPSITSETEKWINILFNEESEDRKGRYMLRGFTRIEAREMEVLHLHYGDYSRCLSFWAYNDDEFLIYTFCEGDTTLQMFPTREEYEAEKERTLTWYREEAS